MDRFYDAGEKRECFDRRGRRQKEVVWGRKVGVKFPTHFLADEVGSRIVEKGFEDGHEGVFVLAEQAEGKFARFAKGTCSWRRPLLAVLFNYGVHRENGRVGREGVPS